jgi:crotonobetainyl-CoA:carnitine CoA-transferase CaiB-like acyl-CoA transferase
MKQVLSDVVVADFTQMMQGGWASQKLGDMGADVIKIEPLHGELERQVRFNGEMYGEWSYGFLAKDRNKRSVALDLKSDEGYEAALDIVREADVVMENFRPDVMERLGLDYETVKEVNPSVIYVSGSAYGSSGPYADRPGQDLLYQAMTGLAANTGRAGDPPTGTGSVVVDAHSATLIALYTMYALFHRELTGEGQKIEANLLNSAIDFQCNELTYVLNAGEDLTPSERNLGHPMFWPPYGIYETESSHIAIGMSSLTAVGETFGSEELCAYDDDIEAIFEDRDRVHRLIESYTAEESADRLVDMLSEVDVQAVEVAELSDLEDNPQVQHNDMILEIDHPEVGTFKTVGFPVEMSESEETVRYPPPSVGEHTEEVLEEMGYSADEIGAITGADRSTDED